MKDESFGFFLLVLLLIIVVEIWTTNKHVSIQFRTHFLVMQLIKSINTKLTFYANKLSIHIGCYYG